MDAYERQDVYQLTSKAAVAVAKATARVFEPAEMRLVLAALRATAYASSCNELKGRLSILVDMALQDLLDSNSINGSGAQRMALAPLQDVVARLLQRQMERGFKATHPDKQLLVAAVLSHCLALPQPGAASLRIWAAQQVPRWFEAGFSIGNDLALWGSPSSVPTDEMSQLVYSNEVLRCLAGCLGEDAPASVRDAALQSLRALCEISLRQGRPLPVVTMLTAVHSGGDDAPTGPVNLRLGHSTMALAEAGLAALEVNP